MLPLSSLHAASMYTCGVTFSASFDLVGISIPWELILIAYFAKNQWRKFALPKPGACAAGLSLRLCIVPSKMDGRECLPPSYAVGAFHMYEYDVRITTTKTVLEEEVLEGILT